jgi:toxin YoeB
MNLKFTPHAWEDYEYWLNNDLEIAQKVHSLLKDIKRSPFKGLGKPEPLKNDLKGYWSRRITESDRLVYKVQGTGDQQECIIIQCRFHY